MAAVSSGLLLTLCYPRWDQTWLCWLALTPLICAVFFAPNEGRRAGLKKAALGYCAGVTFFWTVFSWLTTVTGIGWFMVGLYMGCYFAFWSWLLARAVRHTDFLSSAQNIRIAFFAAAAWVALEYVRSTLFSGWGWNTLGVALHRNLPLIQICEITGVAGLSFLVAFCNVIAVVTVYRFILEARRGRLRPHYDFSLAMALVVLVFLYGVRRLQDKPPAGFPLRVAAIQANIPQEEKFDPAFEEHIFERYTQLTLTALAVNPQLLVWPEVSTPRGIFADERNNRFVLDIAARGSFNFLLGSLDWDDDGDHNMAALLTQAGEKMQIYHKMHLVPFGEYIPLRHSFPLFAMIAGDLVPGDFAPGKEVKVLQMENPAVKIAPLICFEDTLGDLTRQFVLKGAQLLVNITNDGWFQRSQGAEQHLANAVFRTVEMRRPLLRCANTGVTCTIDRDGRITHALRSPDGRHFLQGILFSTLLLEEAGPLTFYTRNGDLLSFAACAITLCATAYFVMRRRPTS